jgi:acyl-CoA synthetase (NDP forming)
VLKGLAIGFISPVKTLNALLAGKDRLMDHTSSADILSELKPFFYPRAIAVVGVSQNPTGAGTCMVRALQGFGFPGSIYPVNPRLTELLGLPVYPSVSAIPGEVDFARIYVPAASVLSVVRECRQKGIPAVEIFTGGFKEMGTDEGRKMEAELTALAGHGMRIVGPNCFGIYSPDGRVTQIPGESYPRESGSMGFLAQSGGLSEDVFRYATDYGLKFSYGVSYGNACDVDEIDLLRYFEADPKTRIVAAYLEGVKRGREFFEIARRLMRTKPLLIWKAGLTPSGARVTASHTGSLAGGEKVWAALFQQTGAVQVYSLWEFLDTASAFYHLPPQADPRVAVIGGGGGVGVAFSDACYREGLVLAELSQGLQQKIASFLAPLGTSARNPVDVGAPFPSGEILEGILENLIASKEVGSIVLDKVTPSIKMRQLKGYAQQIGWEEKPWLEEIPVRAARKCGLPIIVILPQGGETPGNEIYAEWRRLRDYYLEHGVAVYPTSERALKSLGRLVRYYQKRQNTAEIG